MHSRGTNRFSMKRCLASWAYCSSAGPRCKLVRESAMKPVGKPDALIGHVRFDERGWETGRCRMAQATAPLLDSYRESWHRAP